MGYPVKFRARPQLRDERSDLRVAASGNIIACLAAAGSLRLSSPDAFRGYLAQGIHSQDSVSPFENYSAETILF